MNLVELQRKLIALARANPPSDAVPYAFEKRIMARLQTGKALDPWTLWGRSLSRAAACCVVFMLSLAIGTYFLPAAKPPSLSQDVEQALYAAVDNGMGNVDQDLR